MTSSLSNGVITEISVKFHENFTEILILFSGHIITFVHTFLGLCMCKYIYISLHVLIWLLKISMEFLWNINDLILVSGISLKFQWSNLGHWNFTEISVILSLSLEFQWNSVYQWKSLKLQWNFTEIPLTFSVGKTLTFCDRTDDVTYCADVTLFLRTTSGGLSLTAAFFWTDFSRRFIALNAIWAHFLGTKLCFYPMLYLLNTLIKTKLTRNSKKKKKKKKKVKFSDERVEEYVEA